MTAKVHFAGTHRIRQPADTLELISPLLPEFGVTRIADVTGLDVLGIPVAMAVRPLASTLSVSQGKGATFVHAAVSAAMESIELWHAETARPEIVYEATAAADVVLPYDLLALDQYPGSLLTTRTVLDWVTGTGVASGCPVPVPIDAVSLAGGPTDGWRPVGIRASSNGLASGNSVTEAALHGLYELIERDALAGRGTPVDPKSITDPGCAELIDRILGAGASLQIRSLPSRIGVPCFRCLVWSADFPVCAEGSGAHSTVDVALSRAVTEAAQSRLTAITGSRDDTGAIYGAVRHGLVEEPEQPAVQIPFDELEFAVVPRFDDIDRELDWLADAVYAEIGAEPITVVLGDRGGFAVVRVLAPGLNFFDRST